jgi:hypothetical protein
MSNDHVHPTFARILETVAPEQRYEDGYALPELAALCRTKDREIARLQSLVDNAVMAAAKRAVEAPAPPSSNERLREAIERWDGLRGCSASGIQFDVLLTQRALAVEAVIDAARAAIATPETATEPSVIDELIAQCESYHVALDMMFALLIEKTKNDSQLFCPSKSGYPWDACTKGHALIQRLRSAVKSEAPRIERQEPLT